MKITNKAGQPVHILPVTKNFNSGEVNVLLQLPLMSDDEDNKELHIEVNITSSDDIIRLLMTTDALRRLSPTAQIHLVLPYMPFSRQDRVMVKGEALSIKVFANLINSQRYATVTSWDIHSEVTGALFDNFIEVPQEKLVYKELYLNKIPINNMVLVSPDAGALKKICKYGSYCSFAQAWIPSN